jgi:hypothetical protein
MLYIFHICLLCATSSNGCGLGGGGQKSSVMREREKQVDRLNLIGCRMVAV